MTVENIDGVSSRNSNALRGHCLPVHPSRSLMSESAVGILASVTLSMMKERAVDVVDIENALSQEALPVPPSGAYELEATSVPIPAPFGLASAIGGAVEAHGLEEDKGPAGTDAFAAGAARRLLKSYYRDIG